MRNKPFQQVALVLLAFTVISACDKRNDYFIDVNKAPVLSILKDGSKLSGSSVTDSVKMGIPYSLQYNIEDEEPVKLDNTELQGTNQIVIGENSIIFSGVTEGLGRISLWTKDSFGAKSEFSLNFSVFRNLFPVVRMAVSKIAIASPYEVEVDASGSYDRDARFGGQIVLYEYTFGNFTFTSTLSKVRYIFGSAGQKKISVRVKDNNGDWSTLSSLYIVFE